ncbi:branched-chain amino acid aminotransferase [Ancylobacter pratisalsi]|uniref:Probable branched-chain-amino-acid aminotransferase n=1 Tax=Ancylobacter pratisalsi TaxID=1745854 RepID=A0A6P1YPM9_9HYPH|nr:branched-chain amino acid aminotransferase [Ancylobacter pratisalsi]QIB35062.1 branched-chain amino acid aminotransferase [Ancylobacter pratisalsi]
MTHRWSPTWTYLDGAWHEGNVPIMGVRTHASWLGTSVFDGARAFEGVTPDLDLHCARINRSAVAMGLKPAVSVEEWMALTEEGLKRFPADAALYIRPMYWAEYPGARTVDADAESTRWCLSLYEAAMPQPSHGTSITLSPFRRPTVECAVTDAKAGALYPNNARALVECHRRGFDNAALCDMLGNVAELATANVFMVKDGVALTPAANGTFLAGITRTRSIKLMRAAGIEVVETSLRWDDFRQADELFTTGNYSKVAPITRIEDRDLQPGPVFRRARELYWDFAHA